MGLTLDDIFVSDNFSQKKTLKYTFIAKRYFVAYHFSCNIECHYIEFHSRDHTIVSHIRNFRIA